MKLDIVIKILENAANYDDCMSLDLAIKYLENFSNSTSPVIRDELQSIISSVYSNVDDAIIRLEILNNYIDV